MRAFFLFPLPSKTFFLHSVTYRIPYVSPFFAAINHTGISGCKARFLCRIRPLRWRFCTKQSLTLPSSTPVIPLQPKKRNRDRKCKKEDWRMSNGVSNQTATLCRTALPAVQWSDRARCELSPAFFARNAYAEWTRRLQRKSHSACAFRERDEVTFHANAVAPSNAGALNRPLRLAGALKGMSQPPHSWSGWRTLAPTKRSGRYDLRFWRFLTL